ncbi:MAG TPA: N-acetyl-gamma-glutamyl-phosphate reductase [Mycobacteriales bacterium]|nr:N-acetyl-gamma-glutamyl-phosphate reductase [Mycobacteriales bacterium]
MGVRVAVAGASGYAGGELLRLLSAHPEVELAALAAGSSAGEPVAAVHPQLRSLAGRRFAATDAAVLADSDVVVLALPHGESAAVAAQLPATHRIVDLGADFRLRDAGAWQRWYPTGGAHAGSWPYGLPELAGARAALAGAARIAVPGCYATAVTLAYAPLLAGGLIDGADLVCVASSGTSGAGRKAALNLLGSEVMGDLSAYRVAQHQHVAEICQSLGVAHLSLTTVLAPMPRGILATCTARTSAGEDELRACLSAAYGSEPFVHLLDEGLWPHTAATFGSNSCHLQLALDADAGRVVIVSALDNLVKGAAGQAVQCLNVMLGIPETTGLPADGVAP